MLEFHNRQRNETERYGGLRGLMKTSWDRTTMTREEIETCWKDPRNRKWGFYNCKADPRVIVPKRLKWMGWTMNVAHPSAIPITLLVIAIGVAPILIVKVNGAGRSVVLITAAVSITVVGFLCSYLASRTE